MSDPSWTGIGDKLDRLANTAKHRQTYSARTGKIDPATGLIATDPKYNSDPTRLYVRLGATQANPKGRGEVVVRNIGAAAVRSDVADIPVLVGYNKGGELKIVDSDDEAAALWAGDAANWLYQGDDAPAALNRSILSVQNILDFKPVYDATNGGLYLYVYPGWANGVRWPGGSIDLSAYQTATASRKAPIVVGYDESTQALVAAAGSDFGLLVPPELMYANIAATWALGTFVNARPIAAVPISDTDTDFANEDIIDIRDLVAVGGGNNPSGSSGVEITRDALIPAGKAAFFVDSVTIAAGITLTVEGELYIL